MKLATRSWGHGDRRFLLIHGLSSSSEGWWRVGPDLAAIGFAVTAPDLRGHGASGDGDGIHLAGYRDDVLALGTGWDVVLGHSLGGLIALACQLAEPSFTRRLILEDPAIGLDITPDVAEWLVQEYTTPISTESIAERYPLWAPQDVAVKVAALQAADQRVVAPSAEAAKTDLWPALSSIEIPVLLLAADPQLDTTVPDAIRQYVSELPGATCEVIAGAGHSLHRDSYDAFWDVLTGWIGAPGCSGGER